MSEKKTYPSCNVTISTEEYRDLIAEGAAARSDADRYATNYWEERTKTEKLQKELDAVMAEKNALANYIKGCERPGTFFGRLFQRLKGEKT